MRGSDRLEQQDSYGRSTRKDRSPQCHGSQAVEARCRQEAEEAKDSDMVTSSWLGARVEVGLCGIREVGQKQES